MVLCWEPGMDRAPLYTAGVETGAPLGLDRGTRQRRHSQQCRFTLTKKETTFNIVK